jgi:ribosomal protein L21E
VWGAAAGQPGPNPKENNMQFKPGDRVTVTNPEPNSERAAYRGKTGTVETVGGPNELIAVKGLEGRVREAVMGRMGFYPDEITKA